MHHVDDVVDPDARELGIDQLPAVLEDVSKVKLGAVPLAHGGAEAAARHRGRAAGGAALGHLDDGDAGFRAFECGHGAGRAAADDQHVCLVVRHGNVEVTMSARLGHIRCARFR
jgi:hypothetical protein